MATIYTKTPRRQCTDRHDDRYSNRTMAEEVHYRHVMETLNIQQERITPFTNADITRLSGNTIINCRISIFGVTHSIKKTKSTCPENSKINKTILSKIPAGVVNQLTITYNATLSAGYFPDCFKGAEMRMLAKPVKPLTRPDRCRPISLLECKIHTMIKRSSLYQRQGGVPLWPGGLRRRSAWQNCSLECRLDPWKREKIYSTNLSS